MSGHRPFSDLTKDWSAERVARSEARMAKLIRRPDMKVSTLRDLIAAMGGELHITATFPDRSIEIANFTAQPV